ncbi:hypothetical protein ACIQ9K_34950 [Streptomyces microflavus]|uniref:hypothetical protein n=1 Tax=Streptomyces microflavus TaxID=1919 RepID=UPI00380E4334
MSSGTASSAGAEDLVGHCYTRGRKFPLVLVKWPGGRGRIWGGPYTLPQAGVLLAVFGLLLLTRGVWAHFGLVNFVIALGVPYGVSLLVRHVQVEGRSPLAVAASAVALVCKPGGRTGGRPVRAPSRAARKVIGVCSVTLNPLAHDSDGREAPSGAPAARPASRTRPTAVVSSLIAVRQSPAAAAGRGE